MGGAANATKISTAEKDVAVALPRAENSTTQGVLQRLDVFYAPSALGEHASLFEVIRQLACIHHSYIWVILSDSPIGGHSVACLHSILCGAPLHSM